jgi:hypothetical protein
MATTAIVARFWGCHLFRPEHSGCGCLWQPARLRRETLPPLFFLPKGSSALCHPRMSVASQLTAEATSAADKKLASAAKTPRQKSPRAPRGGRHLAFDGVGAAEACRGPMPSDHWTPRDERQRLTEAHAPTATGPSHSPAGIIHNPWLDTWFNTCPFNIGPFNMGPFNMGPFNPAPSDGASPSAWEPALPGRACSSHIAALPQTVAMLVDSIASGAAQ